MVRENDSCALHLSQAAVVITPSSYDKRALTCTDPQALTNSLFNLSYLTSVSTLRIAYILASDGGLQLIVNILQQTADKTTPLARFAYSAAMTCLSNIAIRGNQKLRRSLVDAGVIPVVVDLLETIIRTLEQFRSNPLRPSIISSAVYARQPQSSNFNINRQPEPEPEAQEMDEIPNQEVLFTAQEDTLTLRNNIFENPMLTARNFAEAAAPFTNQPPVNIDVDEDMEQTPDEEELLMDVLSRVDDILLAIKLVAYLSKYPDIRTELHKNYTKNVFTYIEIFTSPSNLNEVRRWSLICMRNCFKKDQETGSLRRCGNLKCDHWESVPKEYSKCSRCRRVSYCSKECQRQAWPLHRNWCLKYQGSQDESRQQDALANSQESL